MNKNTADIVIQFLKAAGVARLDDGAEAHLRAALEYGASEYVTFDCDIGPDTPEFRDGRDSVQLRMMSKSKAPGRMLVTCRYSERTAEHAATIAALHLRVARLASLLEVIIETGDRMNGDDDLVLWATVGLRSLESLLQMTDVASELRRMIASNPIPTAT